MKKFIAFMLAFILIAGIIPARPAKAAAGFTPVTGWDMMERLGLGYTFVNTTEARVNPWEDRTVDNTEDAWWQPRIQQWHFESLAMKGFDSYRLLVSWTPHLDENYQIDPAWLDRIQEIADWALDAGLNVIVNTHHEEELYQLIRENNFAESERLLNAIWTQVADRFKNYPEGLIFEIMNEPNVHDHIRGIGWISTDERIVDPQLVDMVQRLDASALRLIRASGGHNDERVVILTSPGATILALPHMSFPANDPYIMVGAFGYADGWNFISENNIPYVQALLDSGIGFVNKEDNTSNRGSHYSNQNLTQLTQSHFTRFAQMGIPSFWCVGCRSIEPTASEETAFFNRVTGEWDNNSVLQALFEAYGKEIGPDYVHTQERTRIYSLANDSAVQNLSVGTSGNTVFATQFLSGSGGTASIVARSGGGHAIQLVNRANPWDSIEIMRAPLNIDLSANDYYITVHGRIINAAQNTETIMSINAQDEPWSESATTAVTGNGSFTLSLNVGKTSGPGNIQQFNRGFRIQTREVISDFIIDDIIIETDAPPASTPTPVTSDNVTIRLTIGNINATVDSRTMELAAAPFIGEGGRTMIPVRFVADAMGATTDWDANTQTVTITHPSIGSINLVAGQALPGGMGTPEIRNGRTFVPVRFIADAMGGDIDWNATTQTVTIILGG